MERLKAWILARLARQASDQPAAWWTKWLAKLTPSQAVLDTLLVVLLLLVVGGAIAVVIGELRAAGVLARRAAAGATGTRPGAPAPGPARLRLADVQAAPPGERARLLLQLVIEVLSASGRLRGAISLTHRELAAQALLDDDPARARLARLAALAERQAYGARDQPEAKLEPELGDGLELYAALADAPGTAR